MPYYVSRLLVLSSISHKLNTTHPRLRLPYLRKEGACKHQFLGVDELKGLAAAVGPVLNELVLAEDEVDGVAPGDDFHLVEHHGRAQVAQVLFVHDLRGLKHQLQLLVEVVDQHSRQVGHTRLFKRE